MFIKRDLIIILAALVAAALIVGCAAAKKDSGGDQTQAEVVEQIAQVLNCVCHAQYGQWLESRHADLNNSPNRECIPCHTGYDVIGAYIEPEPKYFVDCASCHEEDGTKHGAINANLRESEVFAVCTECHGLSVTEGDHHGISEYRYWENEDGDNVGGEKNGPSVSSTTIGAYALSVWSLPDASDWAETDVYHGEVIELGPYSGPYHFNGDRTILDTHFDEIWITNEDDKVTIYTTPEAKLGYVDLDDSIPNNGMMNSNNEDNACLASCHNPHEFDLTVQRQWAAGPHHPVPEGPVTEDGPSAPANWGAVEHDFGSECLRCHSASGFAELNGAYGDAVATSAAIGEAGAYITCNACHDGVNYPTMFNTRLRLDGDAVIFEYDGLSAALTIEDAGASATCIYCHQGRSSGMNIKDNYAYLSTQNFGGSNSHYLAAAGILWSTIGYEYAASPALNYSNVSYFAHNMVGIDDEEDTGTSGPCVTCHMSGEPANHYFSVEVDGELNEICENCHDPAEGHELTLEEVEEEHEGYEEAIQILADEFEADGIFFMSSYPYFFDTSAGGYSNAFDTWTDEGQLGAAFNLNLLAHEPGAFAHNRYYAKRLLFDSIDWIDDGVLDGTIADYSATYPNGAAWLGTGRP